jgi:hypothetical protein
MRQPEASQIRQPEPALPKWVGSIMKRLLGLVDDGRYLITLDVAGEKRAWTITKLGRVEHT